jgi:hypothetical protein
MTGGIVGTESRYVAKAVAGIGWRVWDRRTRRWWGNYFALFPEKLLLELNGQKRPDVLISLCRCSFAPNKES